jgi:hypothetical protein
MTPSRSDASVTSLALAGVALLIATMLAMGNAIGAPVKDYSYLFPSANPGWTAGPVASEVIKTDPMLGDTLKLARSYNNIRTKAVITVVININNCLGSGLIEVLRRGGDAAQKLKAKLYDFTGYKGVEVLPDEGQSYIMLMIGSCRIVTVSRENADRADMARYLAAMDLKSIEKLQDEQFSPQLWP